MQTATSVSNSPLETSLLMCCKSLESRMISALCRPVAKRRKETKMGLIEAAISTNTAKSAGIVTNCVTPKSFGIRTYERGFKSMKTLDFNPCISHTYADRASNPCISNTYEKHGGGGSVSLVWNERAGGVRFAAAPRRTEKATGNLRRYF